MRSLATCRSTICLVVAAAFVLAAAPGESMAASGEIPLTRDGGIYLVQATMNGWLVRPFVVDSGAADVQLSVDVFLTLYPRGTPSPRFLPGGSYGLADGRVVQSRRFVMRSLRIGGYEFPDVTASIGEPGAPLLLGQNVLARLGAWSIDNRRNVLVLGDRGDGPGMGCLSWRSAPATCAVAAIRDHFRDLRPRHDVSSLVLLATDGERAIVLADVVRSADRGAPVRLCGAIQVRRDGTGWHLAGPLALREIGVHARCLP
jgi:hypothetical protein